MKSNFKNLLLIIVPAIIVLVLDRLTKLWVMTKIPSSDGIFVWDNNFCSFRLIKSLNSDMALSINMPNWFIYVAISVIIVFLSLLLYIKILEEKYFYSAALSTILLSASSNLFDRIYFGGVIDFISIKIINFNWAIFNLADVFIIAGLLIVLYEELRNS